MQIGVVSCAPAIRWALQTAEAMTEGLQYGPNYAAFLRDPDGNKIEVVTFAGE